MYDIAIVWYFDNCIFNWVSIMFKLTICFYTFRWEENAIRDWNKVNVVCNMFGFYLKQCGSEIQLVNCPRVSLPRQRIRQIMLFL